MKDEPAMFRYQSDHKGLGDNDYIPKMIPTITAHPISKIKRPANSK